MFDSKVSVPAVSSAEKFRAAGLRQRVITAVIIAAVFFSMVLWAPLPLFQWFVAALCAIAAWEWADLSDCGSPWQRFSCVAVLAAGGGWLQHELFPVPDAVDVYTLSQLMITSLCFWALVLLLVLTYPRSAVLWSSRSLRLLMGVLLLLPLWMGLVFLKQQDDSGSLLLWVVAIVALADIGAYFAGVRFGQHKLAPRVSPGKSWEGVAGGMLANFLLALVLSWWWDASLAEACLLVLTMLLVGSVSVLGDLFESMVKRQRGVKDSGSLLPGHGGILDRIDGWTTAVPVFVLAYLYGVSLW